MKRLGVFGGTFDPVHIGHLRCAWEVAGYLEAPVHLVPANSPVHRDRPGAAAEDRLALLAAALEGQQRLRLDDREIRRGGPSYMVDTLASLQADFPDRRLVVAVGADAFAGLTSWHCWQQLFDLADVLVMSRPGPGEALPKPLQAFIADRGVAGPGELDQAPPGRVLKFAVTALDVSASQVRKTLLAGEEPRYLVPNRVLSLIRERGLYRPPGGEIPPSSA